MTIKMFTARNWMMAGRTVRSVLACLAVLTAQVSHAADDFPTRKPVNLMVPYPAGGASDASARIFSGPIGAALNQTVLVENLGGATGAIAANKVLSAPADGYYIFHGSPNELILAPLTNTAVRYKPEDFQLVHPITSGTVVLLTNAALNVQSMDDFIELAKARKDNPLTYGSVGVGSLYHLMVEYIAKQADLHVLHVPYKGAGPALQDLAGGQIDFAVLPYQVSMKGLDESKRIKIVSAMGNTLPDQLSDIPKISESKLLKDTDFSILGGYYVKRGTPAPIVAKLRDAVVSALQQPSVRASLEMEGRVVATPIDASAVDALQRAEIDRYRTLIKTVGFEAL